MPTTKAKDDQTLYPMLVRVPKQLHVQMKERAEQEERTLAQVVRRAFRDYLETQPAV